MSNVFTRNETIPANGTLILDSANFCFLTAASGAVTFNIQNSGSSEQFSNMLAGTQIKRVKLWSQATFTGTPGVTLTFFYGIEYSREDETNFQTTIATISGAVTVTPAVGSANAPTDHADQVVATTATVNIVAVNALRKSVTVGSLASNAPATTNLRIRAHGSGTGGVELQPGTYYNFVTQGALDAFNGDANGQTVWVQEYT